MNDPSVPFNSKISYHFASYIGLEKDIRERVKKTPVLLLSREDEIGSQLSIVGSYI